MLEPKQPYEIRVLEAPALAFAALWLHGAERDLVLPLEGVAGLAAQKPYTPAQVLAVLQPIAAAATEESPDDEMP